MAIKDIFKVSRKTFFDPITWLDFRSLKILNKTIFSQLRDLFTIPKPTRVETFEQAIKRFGLTEQDVQEITIKYHYYALFFAGLSLAIILFSFYLLFYFRTFLGLMIGIAVAALAISQAFKYDFWVYQINQRRLGCTFAEWKKNRFGG